MRFQAIKLMERNFIEKIIYFLMDVPLIRVRISANRSKSCFPYIGITILPEVSVAPDIVQGRLAALEWEEEKLEVATLMIWYKDRWLSPTLGAFMDMTREVLSR